MSYEMQTAWGLSIAIYLFLGGLGAAVMGVVVITDMFRISNREHPTLVVWGAISSIIFLAVGSGMLFIHLLDHLAVLNVLNPLVLFTKPDAWIAWGTQFIIWMMVWGFFYACPYLRSAKGTRDMPLVGNGAKECGPVCKLMGLCQKYHRLIGWLTIINAVGTVAYTGLLLQSFPAVALWHNPGLPMLFMVSAFSTALAFILLLQYLVIKEPDQDLRRLFERIDLGLVGLEIALVFFFVNYMLSGSESGLRSVEYLWNSWGWLLGFIGFGLIVPLMLEVGAVSGKLRGHLPVVVAAVLVLIGGFLLRHYTLMAGVYEYPW
ncbi:MAG: polysulfide reductase NrfD [Gammaproteobacteria bacterium]|nr:polysulfide reductase NrfD [Gammaproteobacteria bacterium]MBU1723152.1 polysulfide reductase NrfD [Gammaproteobacteria bacterium]